MPTYSHEDDPLFFIREPVVFAHLLAVATVVAKVALGGISSGQDNVEIVKPSLGCDNNHNLYIDSIPSGEADICKDGRVTVKELQKFLTK